MISLNKKNLHHAYCFEGDLSLVKEFLLKSIKKDLGFRTLGNPDFLMREFDKFGINDGKMINEFQLKKPVGGDKKIIIISTIKITREAQNSLLKTFEEPTKNTHFFLLVPTSEILLPTLRSRLEIKKIKTKGNDSMARKFLRSGKHERLESVKKIIKERDRVSAINLLNELESVVQEKTDIKNISPEEILFFETLNKFRGYLNDTAPSIKMILEHIALIAPKM